MQLGKHAGLLARTHLVAHIRSRCGVLANDNYRKSRVNAADSKRCRGHFQVCAEGGGVRFSIDDPGGHAQSLRR